MLLQKKNQFREKYGKYIHVIEKKETLKVLKIFKIFPKYIFKFKDGERTIGTIYLARWTHIDFS